MEDAPVQPWRSAHVFLHAVGALRPCRGSLDPHPGVQESHKSHQCESVSFIPTLRCPGNSSSHKSVLRGDGEPPGSVLVGVALRVEIGLIFNQPLPDTGVRCGRAAWLFWLGPTGHSTATRRHQVWPLLLCLRLYWTRVSWRWPATASCPRPRGRAAMLHATNVLFPGVPT